MMHNSNIYFTVHYAKLNINLILYFLLIKKKLFILIKKKINKIIFFIIKKNILFFLIKFICVHKLTLIIIYIIIISK